MVAYYCNEDLFVIDVKSAGQDIYDITFTEMVDN